MTGHAETQGCHPGGALFRACAENARRFDDEQDRAGEAHDDRRESRNNRLRRQGRNERPRRYSPFLAHAAGVPSSKLKGTPGSYFETRKVSVVFTLSTFGSLGEDVDDELLRRVQILGHAFEQEVDFSRQHVALSHDRPAPHPFLEGHEIGLGLAVEPDHGEHGEFETKLLGIENGAVAGDQPLLLERPHPPETGWRRDSRPPRQLHIGDPPVFLQLVQNAPVGLVQLEFGRHAGNFALSGRFSNKISRSG